MGFTSINDYLNLVTNSGQIASTSWQKMLGANGAFTAGRWYNMGYFEGNPMLSRPGECIPSGYGQLMGNATGWSGVSGFWSYANNTLVCGAGGTAAVSITPTNLIAGVQYALEYTLTWTAGNLTPSLGGTNFTARGASGTFFEIITTINNSSVLAFTPNATFAGNITNISLVQIESGVPLYSTDMGATNVGGAVSPSTKHVVFGGIVSNAANFVPGTWKLVDMLMAYPVNMNTNIGWGNTAANNTLASAVQGNTNFLLPLGNNYSVPFQNGGGAWTYGSGWAYNSANSATATTPSGTLSLPVANFSTPTGGGTANAPVIGYVYNITFTISNLSGSGTMTAGIGGRTSSALTLANGTFTLQATAINTTGALIFTIASGSPSFTLTMIPTWVTQAFTVSSGSPWTYGTNWAYTNATTATITAAGSQGTLSLTVAQMNAGNVPVIGQFYNITYCINVSAWTSMTITVGLGGATAQAITISATGTYKITQQVTAINATGALIFTTTGTHTATLFGVNVTPGNAQVPLPAFQNGGAWTYGAGIAYTSGTSVTETNSSAALTLPLAQMITGFTPQAGQTYNIIFTLTLNSGSGTMTVGYGGSTSNTITISSTTINQQLTAVNNTGPLVFTFTAGTSSVVLSNLSISVIDEAAPGVGGVFVGLPRYSNGKNVKAMLCWHSGAWNLAGNIASSAAHNIQMVYTNELSQCGQVTPFLVAGVASAPIMGHIDNSGVAQNNFGPFIPIVTNSGGLEVCDGGVQSVQNVNLSVSVLASAGANPFAELILCRELLTIPNVTQYVPTERDFMNQIRSMPQIVDGANLQWLFTPGAATAVSTSAYGWLDYAWGT
jgi:hypothetical protein